MALESDEAEQRQQGEPITNAADKTGQPKSKERPLSQHLAECDPGCFSSLQWLHTRDLCPLLTPVSGSMAALAGDERVFSAEDQARPAATHAPGQRKCE